MKFTKMQGTGNDYVYINCFEETAADPAALSRLVSDRHFGIGSDGLVLIEPSGCGDFRMRMFNADGSEGAMCGNAIRCVGKYVYDHGMTDKTELSIETKSGVRGLSLIILRGKVEKVTVDMGEPAIISAVPEPIRVENKDYEFVGISVGNPHAVYFKEGIDLLDLEKIGPAFETHTRFAHRTNTEFVEVKSRNHIRMRVWERGSGETFACGTGAAASAVAAILTGRADNSMEVELRGGSLWICWNRDTNHVFMTGAAEEVFHGEIDV